MGIWELTGLSQGCLVELECFPAVTPSISPASCLFLVLVKKSWLEKSGDEWWIQNFNHLLLFRWNWLRENGRHFENVHPSHFVLKEVENDTVWICVGWIDIKCVLGEGTFLPCYVIIFDAEEDWIFGLEHAIHSAQPLSYIPNSSKKDTHTHTTFFFFFSCCLWNWTWGLKQGRQALCQLSYAPSFNVLDEWLDTVSASCSVFL